MTGVLRTKTEKRTSRSRKSVQPIGAGEESRSDRRRGPRDNVGVQRVTGSSCGERPERYHATARAGAGNRPWERARRRRQRNDRTKQKQCASAGRRRRRRCCSRARLITMRSRLRSFRAVPSSAISAKPTELSGLC